MSKSAVIIEVTRGPVVESRHEGIAAIVKADGTVVESWGDIDAPILPRSANKPIQAMAFVESGAVERFGLGDEHIALSCASHNGEPRHVETVRAWLKKIGLGEGDLECGTHAPRLPQTVEALLRANVVPTAAFNNCSGKHSGFLTTAVQHGEPTKGYITYDHPVQRRLRDIMSDLCGADAPCRARTVLDEHLCAHGGGKLGRQQAAHQVRRPARHEIHDKGDGRLRLGWQPKGHESESGDEASHGRSSLVFRRLLPLHSGRLASCRAPVRNVCEAHMLRCNIW